MSLSSKLTLALSLAALVLFGGVGWWQLEAETRDLERAVEHDVRVLGRTLEVSFENALRDRQPEDLQDTLGELESIDPGVDVFVYDARGARLAASRSAHASRPPPDGPPLQTQMRFVRSSSPGHVELLVPLHTPRGARGATLVLVRSLVDMEADLAATRVRVLLSVLAFVLVVALLTHGLSRWWVSIPLATMVAQMRRVRSGDLAPPRERRLVSRDDEVGQTLRQFEALVAELREARERIDRDAEARRRLEVQLRDLDKMRTIGTLAAGIAHEIGSPLQVLEGRLASLSQRADDAHEVRRVTAILGEQAQRITRIVARFMDVARQRSTASGTSIELEEPVRAVLTLLESEARRRGVETRLIAHPVAASRGDRDAVQQLALNLLRNALAACSEGDRVDVTIEPGALAGPRGEEPAAVLKVEDTGRGMAPEVVARVFEAFFTTRSAEGGTGLGMSVVQHIVHELGGTIEVHSELAVGSAFVVTLPLADTAPITAREVTASKPSTREGART